MEQKAEQTISLTLNPFAEEKANQVDTKAIEKEEIVTEQQLTDEEKKMVDDFVKQIDLNNSELVLQYGAAAQTKMANFSETTLNSVRTKDLGEVGQLMTDLINELKSIDTEEEKGGFSFFRKAKDKVSNLKTKYEKAETNVDHITEVLEGHQIQLMKDIALLDEMYEMNLNHF
ncbi:MAG TPA: toxic anion resistance protein, partial [Candidatus Fimiplasma intestinipullorum]|nr:toxic anion resistance protein [Candidatus Fimiplasma intestinipullorum]